MAVLTQEQGCQQDDGNEQDQCPESAKKTEDVPTADANNDSTCTSNDETDSAPSPTRRVGLLQRWRNRRAQRATSTSPSPSPSSSSSTNITSSTPSEESCSAATATAAAPPPPSRADPYDCLLSLPPTVFSITFYTNPQEAVRRRRLGFTLEERPATGELIVYSISDAWKTILPIDVGDSLETVNGNPCRYEKMEEVVNYIQLTPGLMSVKFRKNNSNSNNSSCDKIDHKNEKHQEKEIRQAIFFQPLDYTCLPNEIDFRLPKTTASIDDDKGGNGKGDNDNGDGPNNNNRTKTNTTNGKNIKTKGGDEGDNKKIPLTIESMRGDWLLGSCLEPDQIVLAINTCPSYDLHPDEAISYMSMKLSLGCDISFKTVVVDDDNKKRSLSSSFRRTTVAVGGSAMVGAGAVLMVTPLHPIGHAMAFGGLGLLGTEFEGPRNATRRASDSIRSLTKKVVTSSQRRLGEMRGNTNKSIKDSGTSDEQGNDNDNENGKNGGSGGGGGGGGGSDVGYTNSSKRDNTMGTTSAYYEDEDDHAIRAWRERAMEDQI